MKVVLFCGGLGLRMREGSDRVPKPMVMLGNRPLIWHVMKYYAHHGHTDFILCLGHRAEVIKDYFLNYNEALSNDFVLSGRNREVTLLGSDIQSWTITFVNTGLEGGDRRAADGGAGAPRRRRVLPGELLRRPLRRAAQRDDRQPHAGAARSRVS